MVTQTVKEFERKLIRTGSIMEFKDGEVFLPEEKCWLVWYRTDVSKKYKGLLNTVSTTKESAEQKREKIKIIGKFNGCECGIAEWLPSKQKMHVLPPDKNEIDIPPKVLSQIKKDIMKNASFISQIDIKDFIVFDTETTGLSDKKDEVVEIGAVRFTDGKVNGTFHSYIIPTVPIARRAFQAHGLSPEFLKKNGRNATDVFREFKEWMGNYVVSGHNLSFDTRMVKGHAKRSGINIVLKDGFCTLKLSRAMMDIPSHKLENIIDIFSLRQGLGSHNAMDDVKATARYANLLSKVYKYTCLQAVDSNSSMK